MLKVVKMVHWDDAIALPSGYSDAHIEAFEKYAVEHHIRFSGTAHQNNDDGVPLFSDGTALTASMRGWGGIMADIWAKIDDKPYTYMTFYC